MTFSQMLNCFIDKRALRSCDICDALQVKKAWLSKVRGGTLLPSEWSIVHEMAALLHLSEAEYHLLCDAYRKERFPREIAEMDDAMRMLFSFRIEKTVCPLPVQTCPTPENGAVIGAEEIRALIHSRMQTAKTVRIVEIPALPESGTAMLRQVFSAPSASPVQWLILLDKTADRAAHLHTAIDNLPFLFSAPAEVRCERIDLTDYLSTAPFPVMLAIDSAVLLLHADCRTALYLEGEAARAHISFFAARFEAAPLFILLHSSLTTFLELSNQYSACNAERVFSISKAPALVFSASTKDVQTHMIEQAQYVQFMQMLQNLFSSASEINDIFCEDSIDEILYSKEYYEYGSNLSTSISVEERRQIFWHTVAAVKSDPLFQYGMLRLSYPKNTNCLGINIWTDGRMLVMLNTESRYYLLTLHEPEIVQEIIRWLQIMQRYGVLLSKEASVRFCEEKLREAGVN